VFDEALTISITERFADAQMWAIEGAAALAIERSSPADSARWLATTTQPRADLGMADDFYLTGDARRAQTLESARAQLGEAQFDAIWAEGLALSLDEAAEEAADSLRRATEG
jgi:hypothetical protein